MRLLLLLGFTTLSLWSHGIDYELKKEGMAIQLSFGAKTPVAYAPYTLYAPDASLAFQEGHADKNGIIAFVPDRTGIWRLKAKPGSDHGAHAIEIEFEIDEKNRVEWISKPLFTKYSAIITGVSLIFGIFGVLLALKSHHYKKRGNS